VLLAAAAALADDRTLTECFPPNTKMVFGISLRSLLDSPVIKSFENDMQKMSAEMLKGQSIPMLELIKSGPLAGFDPLKDIDDVIIAATAGKEKSTGLLFLHGRFGAIRLPANPTSYHGVRMLGGSNKDGGIIALLDETTAILGEEADVRAAIDRRGKPSKLNPALAAKVRSMAADFDLWGVGDIPESVQQPGATADQWNGIDHFEFSAAMRHGLEINGQIHARTAKDAAQMEQSIQMIASMLKTQPASSGTKMDLQTSDGTVTLSIRISEEDLKKGIEAQRAGMLAAKNATVKVTGSETPAPPPGPKTAPKQAQIVNNSRGETVKITLPGSK
jgi:hypothetical protein